MNEKPQTGWGWAEWLATVVSGIAAAIGIGVWALWPADGLMRRNQEVPSGGSSAISEESEPGSPSEVPDLQSGADVGQATEVSPRQLIEPPRRFETTFTVAADHVVSVPAAECAVSWTHHNVAGIDVATVTVSPADGAPVVSASVGPGRSVLFESGGKPYRLDVISIRWSERILSFRIKGGHFP